MVAAGRGPCQAGRKRSPGSANHWKMPSMNRSFPGFPRESKTHLGTFWPLGNTQPLSGTMNRVTGPARSICIRIVCTYLFGLFWLVARLTPQGYAWHHPEQLYGMTACLVAYLAGQPLNEEIHLHEIWSVLDELDDTRAWVPSVRKNIINLIDKSALRFYDLKHICFKPID